MSGGHWFDSCSRQTSFCVQQPQKKGKGSRKLSPSSGQRAQRWGDGLSSKRIKGSDSFWRATVQREGRRHTQQLTTRLKSSSKDQMQALGAKITGSNVATVSAPFFLSHQSLLNMLKKVDMTWQILLFLLDRRSNESLGHTVSLWCHL